METKIEYPSREYPIVRWWYTNQRGKTIEETIDSNVNFFLWALRTFQNITPAQAQHFKERYHKDIPAAYVSDVEPYEYKKGDPESLYCDLCKTWDLKSTLNKYRAQEILLF